LTENNQSTKQKTKQKPKQKSIGGDVVDQYTYGGGIHIKLEF